MSLHRTTRLNLGALSLAFLLAACGGGGTDETPAPGTEALALRVATPATGATEVATDVRPRMVFTHGLDASTATAANIRLSSAQGAEAFTARAADTELTLTPRRRLLPLTTYTLEIGTGLAGTGGQRLASAASVTFTTADASWSPQVALAGPAGGRHQVLVERSGAIMMVWHQDVGTDRGVFASRHTAEGGWSTPQRVDTGAGSATDMMLARGRDGEVFLAFAKLESGVRYSVFATRYTAATGWEAPHALENGTQSAHDVRIAVDAAGNALAVWYQWDGTRYSVWAARRPADAAWGAPGLIESSPNGAAAPQLAMNANGEAIAVWSEFDGIRNSIWAARYTPADGWFGASIIDLANIEDRDEARIAVAPSGEALAIWSEIAGANRVMRGSRYTPAGGWESTVSLEPTGAADSSGATLAMDGGGNAIATWVRLGAESDVWTNRWVPGTGWGTPRRMNPAGAWSDSPALAVNARGEALLVWQVQSGAGGIDLAAARYRPATGWSATVPLATSGVGQQVSLNDSGVGMTVWSPDGGGAASIQSRKLD